MEGLPEILAKDKSLDAARCNLWLCRGIQFDDNRANVQIYTPGQSVEMKVRLTIPHDGSANVSVVDTKSNKMIGDMLKLWPSGYANEGMYYALTLPANNTDFSVTMPDVSKECATAGACVSFRFPLSLPPLSLCPLSRPKRPSLADPV